MKTPAESVYMRVAKGAAEDVIRLAGLLEEATAVQYEPSRKPGRPDDAGIRSKGIHSDPTGEIALDPLRLELRAAVIDGRRELLKAAHHLRRVAVHLERVMDAWAGESDSDS